MSEIKCGTFMDWSFGGILRNWRLRNGITLRRMCELVNMDPGNYSKLERGLLAPPNTKKKIDWLIERVDVTPAMTQLLYQAAFNFHLGKFHRKWKP